MCLSPILIRNPNKDVHTRVSFLYDTRSDFIKVPCGHCSECVHSRQMDILQRCQTMALDHHVFFGTFTYNEEMIPKRSFEVPDKETGEMKSITIRYADIHDFQNTIKRIRKNDAFTRPFSYFVVSELGEKRGRPHFHAMFFLPKLDTDTWMDVANLEYTLFHSFLKEWRRNVNYLPGKFTKPDRHGRCHQKVDSKRPVWKPLCTYFRKFIGGRLSANYDLHYVKPSSESDSSSVAAYVTKYMLKPSRREVRLQQALKLNVPEEDYEAFWLTVRPSWRSSKNFGKKTPEEVAYVRSCVDRSKRTELQPLYLATNGNSYPLSRYYRIDDRIYTLQDEIDFFNKDFDRKSEENLKRRNLDPSQVHARSSNFENQKQVISSHDTFSLISDLIQNG